ncbi:MAG: deoxyribodipyrimidine photolyase [Planctomycetaceae bacterium]|nr:deoxyribodipyrimidine photolyase [Planctomycetaceae bacterium]
MSDLSELRIQASNQNCVRPDGEFVVYWMIANRRLTSNFALQRAVDHAVRLQKPLLIVEALRSGYRWASDRIHRFVLQGMADNRAAAASCGVWHYAYVEPEPGHGAGMLEALAKKACLIVTDDFPCFFLPRMLKSVAERLPVRLEAVDSNGLLPMRATDKVFSTAYSFRRFLQKELPAHMLDLPDPEPLANRKLKEFDRLPRGFEDRWPEAGNELLWADSDVLSGLPIDHTVQAALFNGGTRAAGETLDSFINDRINRYAEERNQPESDAASGLSPFLHFGHISSHEVFVRILQRENWSESHLAAKATGGREGWWGMSPEAESFLDELITWRELGFNMCSKRDDYDQYESLPEWARDTMEEHEGDVRPHLYSLEEMDAAETHDDLWNAAQNQLVTEGRMHNYLRMLWGKKIYEWSASPRDALQVLIELNNRYAVDGRNPNSYSGIFWCLGRYDRAWGPERPIFGKIRYMSSENTARKLKVKAYIQRYARRGSAQKQLWK